MARTVSGCTCRTGGSSSKAASVRRQQEFAPCDRAVFEESDFKLAGVGNWCRIVEDAEASGGKALKLFATDYQWCVQMAVPYGAFDPGVRYRVRVRAKFEKKPDAPDVNVVNRAIDALYVDQLEISRCERPPPCDCIRASEWRRVHSRPYGCDFKSLKK